jgi:hypothetical protein
VETDPGLAVVRAALARGRQQGQPWASAWATAMAAGLDACAMRPQLVVALHATADSWRSAYLGLPATPGEAAVSVLVRAWAAMAEDDAA